jgi:O-antigen ligase
VINQRFALRRSAAPLLIELVSVLAAVYCLGVVAVVTSGRVDLTTGASLLIMPVAIGLSLVRPEWMILAFVAIPPQVLSARPPLQLVAAALLPLFGFLIQDRLHLGIKTGVVPLFAIIVLALIVKAHTTDEAMLAAETMTKLLVFYALIMLAGFHSALRDRLRVDAFINALLVGITLGAVLEPFVQSRAFESITQNPYGSHFSYLAVMGFGVTYVRISLRRWADQRSSPVDALLMVAFLALTVMSYSRATWMAGLLMFALVAVWTGRKAFWVVLAISALLALTVPVVGERILPSGSISTNPDTLALVTTGRSVLWGKLWRIGSDALPFGNGWGMVESLSSTDLFGIATEFNQGESSFVYPHNDFVYLFVQFGIVGFVVLILYWLDLFRRIRSLAHSDLNTRYSVRLLVPIVVVMLFVQLFDNGFAIVEVATRFFIAAGFVFGLAFARGEEGVREIEGSGGADVP